jgi:7,8-dihydro-6-hydroxymethylpterin-pyrophosphokinase
MARVYVSIGSNIGRDQNIRAGLRDIADIFHINSAVNF